MRAIAAVGDGGVVRFDANCTIAFPQRSRITLKRSITIDGNARSVILDGQDASQLFAVPAGVTVTLRGMMLRAGGADGSFGGAIANLGHLVIVNCVFRGNHADGDGAVGGAIDTDGALDIVGSTFVDNHSDGGAGGAIAAYRGTMRVTNSTFIGNHANGGTAGAIWSILGTIDLVNTTIAGNRVGTGQGGAIFNAGTGRINLQNTIVADNEASSSPDVLGSIASARHSLIGTIESTQLDARATDDGLIIGRSPALKPLADNGGPTPTAAIDPTSPAHGVGDASVCIKAAPGGAGGRDQRGSIRTTPCSIGAYEPAAAT